MATNTHTCPTCRKPVSWEGNVFRPFCSDRCRLIDLQGWFSERYRVPQSDESDPDDTEPQNGDSVSNMNTT